jgi:hypothetical protein
MIRHRIRVVKRHPEGDFGLIIAFVAPPQTTGLFLDGNLIVAAVPLLYRDTVCPTKTVMRITLPLPTFTL